MRFDILTAVRFRHSFFMDRSFVQLRAKPSADTVTDLRRQGLLYSAQQDGFLLLYDAGRQSREAQLQDSLVCTFHLLLNDLLFYNYTDLGPANISGNWFAFTNLPGNGEGVLHHGATAGATDLAPVPANFLAKPFGCIQLQLDAALLPAYEIVFAARSNRWCYLLMSEQLLSLQQPGIIDTKGIVQFSAAEKVILPDGKQVTAFLSEDPIPLQQRMEQTFQLVDHLGEAHSIVIADLPGPDISRISASGIREGEIISDIFLY
jgi:hypothetical protein